MSRQLVESNKVIQSTVLLLATRNTKKLRELRTLLRDLPVTLRDLSGFRGAPDVPEDGKTFEENAVKKARTLADWSGHLTLADDSGLMVNALRGAPGVRSARFAGPEQNDAENCKKLLALLEGVPTEKRGAKFQCVLAVARPNETVGVFQGEYEGSIAFGMRGEHGFGYDPVFVDPQTGKTFAELRPAEKNAKSHRRKAIEKFKLFLKDYCQKR